MRLFIISTVNLLPDFIFFALIAIAIANAIFIWNPWCPLLNLCESWVSRQKLYGPICILKGLWYSMRFPCIVYSLETGGEGTLSNSFKFICTCFKFMVHSLGEGGRWCPGLYIDVRLLDTGSFNIGISSFHVTTCFILNLASLTISYGKRLIWNTQKIWNETFETNWAIRPIVVLVFTP